MNAWTPGPGWREVSGTAQTPDLVQYMDGLPIRLWVRESPVPPLPTEPYTVIRPEWKNGPLDSDKLWVLDEEGLWGAAGWDPSVLADCITGFVVLAEPRAVTAKAVIDRAREHFLYDDARRYLSNLATEFGVTL